MARIDESELTPAKIRDRPINGQLRGVLLGAAADAGVDVVRIVSGGQPGSTGQRIGSSRHDGGAAADLELVRNGRTLDFTVPGDLETIRRFVTAAASHGAIGIGAGVDYMGPTRLHVGFGNGPSDIAKVVWGAGGLPSNAPNWLVDAALHGWTYPSGASLPLPDPSPPEPSHDDAADGGARPGDEVAERLRGVRDAVYHYTGGPAFTRAAIGLFQFVMQLPVTGVPDANTWPFLLKYAAFFRYAGWLFGALGVIGLVRSVGGSTPDSYIQALDRFREMLAASADPSLSHAFDLIRQALEAAQPTANAPAWDGILAVLGRLVPGPLESLVATALGIAFYRFGARIPSGFKD